MYRVVTWGRDFRRIPDVAGIICSPTMKGTESLSQEGYACIGECEKFRMALAALQDYLRENGRYIWPFSADPSDLSIKYWYSNMVIPVWGEVRETAPFKLPKVILGRMLSGTPEGDVCHSRDFYDLKKANERQPHWWYQAEEWVRKNPRVRVELSGEHPYCKLTIIPEGVRGGGGYVPSLGALLVEMRTYLADNKLQPPLYRLAQKEGAVELGAWRLGHYQMGHYTMNDVFRRFAFCKVKHER